MTGTPVKKRRRFGSDRIDMSEKIIKLANLTKEKNNTGYFSKKQMSELLTFLIGVRGKND